MSSTYNAKTTSEEVAQEFASYAKGRHVIITGSNIGLGKETARVLAKQGAIVTICCRTVSKGEEARKEILAESPKADITVHALDLSSLASVKKSAETYIASGKPLHLLINNAGIMACPKSLTADGIEAQFGTNHVGHAFFTQLLLPLLVKSGTKEVPARVVNLSSMAALLFAPRVEGRMGILFDDLVEAKSYNSWERYGNSKLANILFALDLNERMKKEGKNVISMSLHPGNIMATNLSQHIGIWNSLELFWTIRKSRLNMIAEGKSIPQGTATTIVCALDPKVEGGKYYEDCQISTRFHESTYDLIMAAKLTKVTNDLIASKGF